MLGKGWGVTSKAEVELAKELERLQSLKTKQGRYLDKVCKYYDAIRKEARMSLLARFRQVFDKEPPNATREWLAEALGRRFQRDYYMSTKGVVPASVRENDRVFWGTQVALLGEGERDEGEVNLENPTIRVVAVTSNPFEKGAAWRVFLVIETCKAGLSYVALSKLLEKLLECSIPRAQSKAKTAFVQWVKAGWTRLVFVEEQ